MSGDTSVPVPATPDATTNIGLTGLPPTAGPTKDPQGTNMQVSVGGSTETGPAEVSAGPADAHSNMETQTGVAPTTADAPGSPTSTGFAQPPVRTAVSWPAPEPEPPKPGETDNNPGKPAEGKHSPGKTGNVPDSTDNASPPCYLHRGSEIGTGTDSLMAPLGFRWDSGSIRRRVGWVIGDEDSTSSGIPVETSSGVKITDVATGYGAAIGATDATTSRSDAVLPNSTPSTHITTARALSNQHVATAPLINNQYEAYSDYLASVISDAPVTQAPVPTPFANTDDGPVLVYSAYLSNGWPSTPFK
ncbi:hypothetical protein IL306_008061 [Fusarium sp. DS 682]|nr:hypothetical protein IL306_008061 [Fusarium sp. DS 682]